MEPTGKQESQILPPYVDFANVVVSDSDMEDGGVVIEGPVYPTINGVKPTFSLDMMMGVYCPKYKDILMRVVPGFLATVDETDEGAVNSVTYTYVGDVKESVSEHCKGFLNS